MSLYRKFALAALCAGLLTSPALADKPRDADRAFDATRQGRAMPLPKIERRVMPFMGGADSLSDFSRPVPLAPPVSFLVAEASRARPTRGLRR